MEKLQGFILLYNEGRELTEHSYSVQRLLDAAAPRGVQLTMLKPEQLEMVVTSAGTQNIFIDEQSVPLPDFVLSRTGSDTTYHAFAVLRQLQNLGVYMCNDADAIYAVKDKLYMHQLLAASNLPSPKTMLAKCPPSLSVANREIGFPLVIKNVTGTQGNGIYLCESEEKFIDVMELVYSNNSQANIILQEFIQTSYGRDIRVFIVGGRVVGCMERSTTTGFKANFSKGATVSPFELTPEIEELALKTAKLFNLEIAGIDLLFDQNGFKVCEANSAPGFRGLEQVVGPIIAESIMDYICKNLAKKYRDQDV